MSNKYIKYAHIENHTLHHNSQISFIIRFSGYETCEIQWCLMSMIKNYTLKLQQKIFSKSFKFSSYKAIKQIRYNSTQVIWTAFMKLLCIIMVFFCPFWSLIKLRSVVLNIFDSKAPRCPTKHFGPKYRLFRYLCCNYDKVAFL